MHDKRDGLRSAADAATAYRRDIDGLRAFAVLSVIAYHAFPSLLKGGFVGVDVFFVISGYLISGHIFASLERQQFSLLDFYQRRVRRIFPALLLVMTACLLFGWFALLAGEYRQLGLHIVAGAGFVSNLALWQESGYFDNSALTKPLLHLWSLGIEEQFYIVWPLVVFCLWRFRANGIGIILLLAAASFAWNTTNFQVDQPAAFYSPLARFWELLAGAALAYHERRRILPIAVASSRVLSFVGAVLLFTSVLLIREEQGFPGWWALLPVAGTVAIIAAGVSAPFNTLIGVRPMVTVGLISYPLYLWHWPLLSFAQIVEGGVPSRELRICLVALTFVLASVTYLLVERPLRFGRLRTAKTGALVVGMLFIGGVGYSVYQQEGMPYRPAVTSMADASAQFGSSIWKYATNDICLNRYPFEEAKRYSYWFCVASGDKSPDVLLLGSSFANHHYPGILAQPAFAGMTVLSIGACAPMMLTAPKDVPASNAPCEKLHRYHQQEYIKGLVDAGGIKLAILDGINLNSRATYDDIQAVREWVDFLESRGVVVVVYTPHIWQPGSIKGCFARPFKAPDRSCDIPDDLLQKIKDDFQPIEHDIRVTNPNTLFFDQNQLFCQTTKCSFVLHGKPLIRDDTGHLSEFGSQYLAGIFVEWARTNAPQVFSSDTEDDS